MAAGWTLEAPAGKTPEELNAIIDQLGTEADSAKRLVAAGATPDLSSIIERARQRQKAREIVAKHLEGQQPEQMGPPAPPEARLAQKTLRMDQPGGMQPAVDVPDVLAALATGGGSAALQTGASEGMQAAAAHAAGMAGLPPWLQSGLGLLAGLAPLARGVAKLREPRSIIPEVVEPEIPRPRPQARPGAQPAPQIEGIPQRPQLTDTLEGEIVGQPSAPSAAPATAQRRPATAPAALLPPPQPKLPPPGPRTIGRYQLPDPYAMPEGPMPAASAPQPMIPPVKRPFEQPFFGQPRPIPEEPGRPVYGEPSEDQIRARELMLQDSPEQQLTDLQSGFAALPETMRKEGVTDPRIARQKYGNIQRSAANPSFNPWTLPNEAKFQELQKLQGDVKRYGQTEIPSQAQLSKADFAERLERQRNIYHEKALSSFGPRSKVTPDRTIIRARSLAAADMNKGDQVLTPQGPGVVIERVQGAATAQDIGQRMEWEKTRLSRGSEPIAYANAPSSSVSVQLADGRKGIYSAWNVVKTRGEYKPIRPIPQLDPAAKAKIGKLGPRRERGPRGLLPSERTSSAEDEYWRQQAGTDTGDEDFDWATGQPKKR